MKWFPHSLNLLKMATLAATAKGSRFDVTEKFLAGEIIGFTCKSWHKPVRLFYKDESGTLCFFKENSSRRGYVVPDNFFETFEEYVYEKKAQFTPEQKTYNTLFKYLKMARQAEHTNKFIRICLRIPPTFQDWQKAGSKGLYESGITTGNRKDGEVISLASVQKRYPYIVDAFQSAMAGRFQYDSGRVEFRNYEATLSVTIDEDGNAMGHLAMEFKNCGNGYYYLMINEKNFIGYDVD